MKPSRRNTWIYGSIGWLAALLLFFPVFWMALTAFKSEQSAYATTFVFKPTLESFREVFSRGDYAGAALNSILVSLGSTVLCFLLAIPAAYCMAFFPTSRTHSVLVWMLSTKMMPAAGALLPVYLLFRA